MDRSSKRVELGDAYVAVPTGVSRENANGENTAAALRSNARREAGLVYPGMGSAASMALRPCHDHRGVRTARFFAHSTAFDLRCSRAVALRAPKSGVRAVLTEKERVSATLDYLTVLKYHDLVRVQNCG